MNRGETGSGIKQEQTFTFLAVFWELQLLCSLGLGLHLFKVMAPCWYLKNHRQGDDHSKHLRVQLRARTMATLSEYLLLTVVLSTSVSHDDLRSWRLLPSRPLDTGSLLCPRLDTCPMSHCCYGEHRGCDPG